MRQGLYVSKITFSQFYFRHRLLGSRVRRGLCSVLGRLASLRGWIRDGNVGQRKSELRRESIALSCGLACVSYRSSTAFTKEGSADRTRKPAEVRGTELDGRSLPGLAALFGAWVETSSFVDIFVSFNCHLSIQGCLQDLALNFSLSLISV